MRHLTFTLMTFSLLCGRAQAHFLWLAANPDGKPGEIAAYFGETAAPDDPDLLKKFAGLKAVAVTRSREGKKRQEFALQPADDSLRGSIPKGLQTPLTAQQTYGVVTRGGEAFLLKYAAKTYPTALPGSWQAVNDPELAALEITPQLDGEQVVLNITWHGKLAAGDQVTIEGPGLEDKSQGETDADGKFRCRLPASGLFSIRARHIEQEAGTLENQDYASIRTYATLALPYAAPKVAAVKHDLPSLPQGVTSFGAAIAGDDVYVYGGHFGDAHHYSSAGQSNEFRRLSLRTGDAKWENLPSGPKLTGLAMVSHDGKLYRVGGFTAKNDESSEQDLWSQDGFAMFDPDAGKWSDLPALPEPRSSHDAAVLDGKIYVVGGWNMAGSQETVWHKTAWMCDLSQSPLSWTEIPSPPFLRRALSVAAFDGKLYVLGGMQETGGPTTRVDIFDPAAGTWSQGPALIGSGMEGFGNSSFAWGDRLVATTMSGSIQQLSADGSRWEVIGQLRHPRFFHRQLITPAGDLIVVGGASMQTGKTNSVELFRRSER